MKKYVRKLASLLLALNLMICIIALPVLAAEVDPCAVICPHSNWRITEYYDYIYENNLKHRVTPCEKHTCGDCGYSYDLVGSNSYLAAHTWSGNVCTACKGVK